jgi:PKD repeat protein
MKRLTTTLVLTMFILSSLALLVPAPSMAEEGPLDLHATTDRTVLVELFTGADCDPCIYVDLGLEDFMANYNRDKVAALVYHRSIPEYDKLETLQAIDRQAWYIPSGGHSTPNFWVDGMTPRAAGFSTRSDGETWFQDKYDTQSVNASQLTITGDGHIAPNLYGKVWFNVTALETLSYSNLYFHAVVVRKYYGPWNGGNGVEDHYYTVRKMLPDDGGQAFVLASGQTQSFSYEFDLSSDTEASDKDDMAVIGFVQTHSRAEVTAEGGYQRYVAPVLQSAYANIRTIGNVAPSISSGHLETPDHPTQDDDVTFKVFYKDADDWPNNGPSVATVYFKNETQQVYQNTMTEIFRPEPWTEGRWMKFTTKLAPGSYVYRFAASDGFDDATGDTGWNGTAVLINPRNKLPKLSGHGFVPYRGDTSTTFWFNVLYMDPEDEPPVSAKIYINGIARDMTTDSSGPWNDWVTYYYETTLNVGVNHKFYFEFSDGFDTRRYPPEMDSPNWYLGPEVYPPNNEPYLSSPQFTPANGSRIDDFTFTIIYTDTEDDYPSKSFIYIDDVPQIMDSDTTDYAVGATFRYTTSLGLGPHWIHFTFSDGLNEVRYPVTGEMEGPLIRNLAPVASIDRPADGVRFTPDDYISFSALETKDPEDDDLIYLWTSDIEGTLSAAPAFDKPLSEGTHNITLTVTDEYDGQSSQSISILVKERKAEPYFVDHTTTIDYPTDKDIVRYTLYLNNRGEIPASPLMVSFLVDNTYVADEVISVPVETLVDVKFNWVAVAGDHVLTFEIPGVEYRLDLSVQINKLPTASPIILNQGDAKGRLKINEEIYFKASASDANDDDLSYLWDFGDSFTSTQENPSHIFNNPGTYTIKLTVTDTRDGVTEESFDVVVKKPAEATNGGISGSILVGIIIAVVLVVIIGIWVMMTRSKGDDPGATDYAPEEPRPDVPDYLMPEKLTPPAEPEFPDYSNGLPPEAPTDEAAEEPEYPDYSEGLPEAPTDEAAEEPEYPDYSEGLPEENGDEEKQDDGYLGY